MRISTHKSGCSVHENEIVAQSVLEEDIQRGQRERFGAEFALGQQTAVVVLDRFVELLRFEHLVEESVFWRLARQLVVDLVLKPTDRLARGQQFVVAVYDVTGIHDHLLSTQPAIQEIDEQKEKQIET